MDRNWRAALASLLLALWATSSVAQAPAPKWGELEQAVGKEDYVEARKLADAILQRGSPPDRLKATVIYGRILLALGDKDQAKQYLATLSKPGNDPTGGQMTAIYTAWFTALDGKPDEGIKALEKVLEGKAHNETTAEAADVLAMLYMVRGDQEKAKKTVDFGLGVLQYMGKKDGYLVTLLQGRLNSNITAGEAKRAYDAAERLRAEKKFAEAGQAFAVVCNKFPKSEWAHASGFRMGECLLGLDRPSQAATHWQKFIKESPAGPWRGQTNVAVIDLTLESLDLKKATEYTMAASAILAKIGEKGTVPLREASKGLSPFSPDDTSWKEATYNIHLRHGIVSLVDGRFDAAAQAFEQAKQASGAAPLDRLIEAAKQKAKLIPDELGVGDDRAAVALALGNIYNLLHQYDIAKGYFTLPLSGPMRSRSAAHRSFAGLGLARVLTADQKTGSGKSETSKSANPKSPPSPIAVYEASLKEYPNGSWHDETLYRLATMIQDQADAKLGKSSKPVSSKRADQPATSLSPQERGAEAKAEKERLAALLKAKGEALSYWQEIIQRFPQSPRCEQAFYMAGVLQIDMDECDEGLAFLDRFVETYPNGACTGEALLILGQDSLERRVDSDKSQDYLSRLDSWIAQTRKEGCDLSVPPPASTATPSVPIRGPINPKEGQIVKLSGGIVASRPRYNAEELVQCRSSEWYLDLTELDCAKLRGFLYFVNGQKDQALTQYARIMKLDAAARKTEAAGDWSDYTRLKWGLDHGYLFAYPEELARYDDRQRLAVLLADFYYVNQRFDDAAALAQRLSKAEFGRLRGEAAEYPQYLYATCVYWTHGRSEAYGEYMKVLGSGTVRNAKNLSITKERAAYAAGHITLDMPDGPLRKQGKEMLRQLAFSGKTTHYAYQARIAYAAALINEGNREEGIRLLETFPESSGQWQEIAMSYVKAYREAEKYSKNR